LKAKNPPLNNIAMKTLGERLSPILEEVEGLLWEREAAMPNTPHEFTEEGFRAACKIFMAAMMDKIWVLQEKENMPIEDCLKMAEHAGNEIKRLVKQMTNIDTTKLYD